LGVFGEFLGEVFALETFRALVEGWRETTLRLIEKSNSSVGSIRRGAIGERVKLLIS